MKKTIVLNFSETSWGKPIVSNLSRDYNLVFSILRAQISPRQKGVLVLEISGSDEDYQKGIEYLKSFDIRITPIEKDVVRIEKKCLHCGLCTSICPTKALYIDRATMEVLFDVNKCIICEACVKVCPPRAMQVNLQD